MCWRCWWWRIRGGAWWRCSSHIRDIAYGIAGLGIIFAVIASLWIAAHISRPIEELARAAGRVAEGDWDTRVDIRSLDEVGELARNFNNMTRQLAEQRDRLVQTRAGGGMARAGAAAGARAEKSADAPADHRGEHGAREEAPEEAVRRGLRRKHCDADGRDRQSENDCRTLQRFFETAEAAGGGDGCARGGAARGEALWAGAGGEAHRAGDFDQRRSPCRSWGTRSCCIGRCRIWC